MFVVLSRLRLNSTIFRIVGSFDSRYIAEKWAVEEAKVQKKDFVHDVVEVRAPVFSDCVCSS